LKNVLLATTILALAAPALAQTTAATDPFNCNNVSRIVDGQPPAAALAGYNTLTLVRNWIKDTQDGTTANATQNSDGSMTVAGGGDTWNGQLETARLTYPGFVGEAFGGGFYAQATVTVPGPTSGLSPWTGGNSGNQWPSFWANSVNGSIETDFMEMMGPTPGEYGATLHNWTTGTSQGSGQSITAPAGNTLNGPNTYGFLWIPATATRDGSMAFYLNGQQVGSPVTWTQANPGLFGIIDGQQMVLRLGAGANSPATFSNVQVWQASTAGNSINGQPAPALAAGVPSAAANAAAQSACTAAQVAAAAGLQTTKAATTTAQTPASAQVTDPAAWSSNADPGGTLTIDQVAALAAQPIPDVPQAVTRTVDAPGGTMPTPAPVSGSTSFTAASDFQTIVPRPGNDTGTISGNNNVIAATGGVQTLTVSGTGNQLVLGPFDDTVIVTGTGNSINGGGGSDRIILAYPSQPATPPTVTVATAGLIPPLTGSGNIFVASALGRGILTISGTPFAPADQVDVTLALVGLAGYTGANAWNYLTITRGAGGCTLSVQGQAIVTMTNACPTGHAFVKAEAP
jgi:hypothetical protein